MHIVIVTKDLEFKVEVGLNEPVLEVKQKIEHILGVEVASQHLSFYGFELIDGLDMEDYPIIGEGSKIDLSIKPFDHDPVLANKKIHITIKISTKMIDLEVETAETVRSLKEKIHIINGTPIKRLKLLFMDKAMNEENRWLSDYGVCDKSVVTVIQKNVMECGGIECPTRRLSFMVQTPSCLLDSAIIPVEVKDSVTVADLTKLLLNEKLLPQDNYFFIHKQRIMQGNCSLHWHGVENGDFLYVFRGTVTREIG